MRSLLGLFAILACSVTSLVGIAYAGGTLKGVNGLVIAIGFMTFLAVTASVLSVWRPQALARTRQEVIIREISETVTLS